MRYEPSELRGDYRKLATERFMRCPLCGALNAEHNDECFVCRWHGHFDRDAESVCEALDFLIERCPELAGELSVPKPPETPVRRAKKWLTAWVVRTLVCR